MAIRYSRISYFVYESDSGDEDEYQVSYRQRRMTFGAHLGIAQIIDCKRRNSIIHYFYETLILHYPAQRSQYPSIRVTPHLAHTYLLSRYATTSIYVKLHYRRKEVCFTFMFSNAILRTSFPPNIRLENNNRSSISMIEDYYKRLPYENTSSRYLARSNFERPKLGVIHECIFYSYIHDYYNQTCHDYRHESGA
jgi:hypothetical protein